MRYITGSLTVRLSENKDYKVLLCSAKATVLGGGLVLTEMHGGLPNPLHFGYVCNSGGISLTKVESGSVKMSSSILKNKFGSTYSSVCHHH